MGHPTLQVFSEAVHCLPTTYLQDMLIFVLSVQLLGGGQETWKETDGERHEQRVPRALLQGQVQCHTQLSDESPVCLFCFVVWFLLLELWKKGRDGEEVEDMNRECAKWSSHLHPLSL